MRVLQVITLSEWGGAQKVVYDLTTGLARERFQTEVACAPGGPLVAELREKGIVIHEIAALRRDLSVLQDIKALFALFSLMRRGRYDIVHCHSSKAGLLGRLAARAAGVPRVFFTVHGWGFANRKEYGAVESLLVRAEKAAAGFTSALVCVSRATREEGLRRGIAGPKKYVVIYNGLNPVNREVPDDTLRRETGAAGPLVVTAGRLVPQKQPLVFLRAAARLGSVNPAAGFVLIGDGPLGQECRAFIKTEGLAGRVFMAGFRTDVPGLLTGADLFVLLSAFEGLPLTVMEAMLAGLPVVAYAVGGLAEMVEDGVNGFLLPPGDLDGAVDRISALLDDPRRRKEMGETGREIALARFGREAMVRAYAELYERGLSPAKGR
ncbi:MAG: glycosyltransferase family 4 protein [Peptococcaceae bacterium]|jgi:glycosyltransferase involved in cell wall biosynthesis|nr:glycosyltransferase family 4 protein [Peptococcaceae bacterium]